MKQLKQTALCLLLALLLCLSAAADTAIVQQTDAFYVADYADVLSQETEKYVCQVNAALEKSCGGQIVVVTINFLNDLDSEQYAYQVLSQWKVGDSKKNNGAVLLLVPGEGKFWLTVGYGIEDYFDGGRLDQILTDYLEDDFDRGEYDTAVRGTVDALVAQYDQYYNTSTLSGGSTTGYTGSTAEPDYDPYDSYETGYSGASWRPRSTGRIWRLLLFLLVAYLFYKIISGGGRGGSGGGGGGRRNNFIFLGSPWGFRGGYRPPPPGGFGGRPGGFGGRPGGGFGGGHSGGSFGGSGGMGRGGGGGGHGGGAGRR